MANLRLSFSGVSGWRFWPLQIGLLSATAGVQAVKLSLDCLQNPLQPLASALGSELQFLASRLELGDMFELSRSSSVAETGIARDRPSALEVNIIT